VSHPPNGSDTKPMTSNRLLKFTPPARLWVCLVSTVLAANLHGQEPSRNFAIEVQHKGSVPPVAEWYSCTRNLDSKLLSQQAAEGCLRSILSHPQFSAGKVSFQRKDGQIKLFYFLKSPTLSLTEVDYGLSRELLADFGQFTVGDEDVLRQGDYYDPLLELHTTAQLNQFLSAKGMIALLSRSLRLDYKQRTGKLAYRVWEGPSSIPGEPLLPGSEPCRTYVRNLSELDLDDNTPLPLVNSLLMIRRTPCFSARRISKSRLELLRTDLFSAVDIKITASGKWRDISLRVRAKPTTVDHLELKWYGVFSKSHPRDLPPLPLVENRLYSRSQALRNRDLLVQSLTKPALKVKVCEEDVLAPDHHLIVIYHILGGTADSLWIDGEAIPE